MFNNNKSQIKELRRSIDRLVSEAQPYYHYNPHDEVNPVMIVLVGAWVLWWLSKEGLLN